MTKKPTRLTEKSEAKLTKDLRELTEKIRNFIANK